MYYTCINKIVHPSPLFLRNNSLRVNYLFRTCSHVRFLSFVQVYHSIKSIRDFRQVVYRKKTMPCYMEQLAYRLCKLPYNLRCIDNALLRGSCYLCIGIPVSQVIGDEGISRIHNFSVVLVAIQLHEEPYRLSKRV